VWQKLVAVSKRGFDDVYSRLNVSFPTTVEGTGYCGESFYQTRIPAVVAELEHKKLARTENGAVVLYTGLPQAKTLSESGEHGEMPLFLCKSEGGFGYDSTDMAAAKFRLRDVKANRVLYVTDAGQEVHFAMVFHAAALAGWTSPTARLEHVKFGVVRGADGAKFKTRAGDTVALVSLLEDARAGMLRILEERSADAKATATRAEAGQEAALAARIGYAAIKYADLRVSRIKDYVFDHAAMLSADGDTAVFLMYTYARISSICDKAPAPAYLPHYQPEGASRKERAIALRVMRFQEAVELAVTELAPHVICGYAYKLCQETSSFLTEADERIIDKADASLLEPVRGVHRLLVVKAVKAVLRQAMALVGVEDPPEKM